jgi:hypothetical protein
MGHPVRTVTLVALGSALVCLLQSASAVHWCGQTAVTLSPLDPPAGRQSTFTVTVQNNGVDNTQLYSEEVRFSWEGVYRNMSSGIILAGQSRTFTVSGTPPSQGAYSVDIRLNGTSSGDIFRETSTCERSFNLTAGQAVLPGLEPGLLLAGLALFVAAARVRRDPR